MADAAYKQTCKLKLEQQARRGVVPWGLTSLSVDDGEHVIGCITAS